MATTLVVVAMPLAAPGVAAIVVAVATAVGVLTIFPATRKDAAIAARLFPDKFQQPIQPRNPRHQLMKIKALNQAIRLEHFNHPYSSPVR